MQVPNFGDYEFVNAAALNSAFSQTNASKNDIFSTLFNSGIVNPSGITISPSLLTASVVIGTSTRFLFSSGYLSGGYGTTAGSSSNSYAVDLSSFVPSSGSQTVFIVASYASIGQNLTTITGPTAGHPDYDPTFVPYSIYTSFLDSVAISATTSAPDNSTAIEIGRVTLTSGQTTITSVSTVYQVVSSVNTDVSCFTPSASATIFPSSPFTVVLPNITAAGIITLTGGSKVGQSVRVYGHGTYAVTVALSVSTGSPAFIFPDNSIAYSRTLPLSYAAYIDLRWDGTNWRANTQGIISVVGAAGPAITLTDLVNGGVAPLNSPYLITPYTNSTPGTTDNSARIPNTNWFYSGALTYIAAALGFTYSGTSSAGYIIFPSFLGGIIIQYGVNAVGSPTQCYFPLTFPNTIWGMTVSECGASGYGTWAAARPTVHGYSNLYRDGYLGWAEIWNGSGFTGGSFSQAYIAIGR